MRLILSIACIILFIEDGIAQRLTYERMSVFAYEDMSDWIRRFPGMYPMDYGVAGAPVTFRPWGMHSWYTGVERDGIPWHRVSDGLYDSNLDSPEELESLTLDHFGSSPLATIKIRTRDIASDTATTIIRLREGYYGFGRVDFVHSQRLSQKVSAEGRGRLWWYDGLRLNDSKSRFYNLSGKLKYQFSEAWLTRLEYGGSNVDAQSPTLVGTVRPDIYSEREYGTLRVEKVSGGKGLDFEAGLHARQDREIRDQLPGGFKLFGLRERYVFGFAGSKLRLKKSSVKAQAGYEDAAYIFPGINEKSEDAIRLSAAGEHEFSFMKAKARYLYRRILSGGGPDVSLDAPDEASAAAGIESRAIAGFSLRLTANGSTKAVPAFWRLAKFPIPNRNLMVNDEFASNLYYGGRWEGFESKDRTSEYTGLWSGAIQWRHNSSSVDAGWMNVRGSEYRFRASGDTLYFNSEFSSSRTWQGPTLDCDVAITRSLRFQSWSAVECEEGDLSRALDTRSFSRVLFSRDFFKSPLHIDSYVAYEHLGRRRAVSDVRNEVLGPAHLLHFRTEATIEGVTLIWGVENLTGQNYEYLPGYLVIRKEEYFGLKWTLKL